MATEEQVVATLSEKLGYQRVPLEGIEFGPGLELALRLVPHEFAERNQLLPYAADPTWLWVAMADPTNVGVIDELAFRTGRRVKVAIGGDRELARAIRRLYLGDKKGVEAIALDEQDDLPVEMVGPLDGGYPQELDSYFERKPGAAPVAPPPAPAAAPAPAPAGTPPPLPQRPAAGPPTAGPEARLAEAVRGLRMEDLAPALLTPQPAAPRLTPLPVPPPELVVEVIPDAEVPPDGEFGPRIEAILDSVDRIGHHEGCPPELLRLSRLSAAMVRLMLRKGLVTEQELVSAFLGAERGPPKR
jgi:type IV pilus assembly protein PilB